MTNRSLCCYMYSTLLHGLNYVVFDLSLFYRIFINFCFRNFISDKQTNRRQRNTLTRCKIIQRYIRTHDLSFIEKGAGVDGKCLFFRGVCGTLVYVYFWKGGWSCDIYWNDVCGTYRLKCKVFFNHFLQRSTYT